MSPRGEQSMVPEAEFESYYGRQILKTPTWKTPDVPLYLFLGGLAGASAVLAEGARLTGRPELQRVARLAAAGGAAAGTVALVHDLGRPERFLNMLRVFKPTSPLSVGSYVLAPFSGLAGLAAASQVSGRLPRLGRLAGLGAAALGPPLATYTAALVSDTAVPAWHEAHRELPFIFAGSGATARARAMKLLEEVGVAARASAAKSTRVTSTSCPTAVTTGTRQAATARTTASSLKAMRSSAVSRKPVRQSPRSSLATSLRSVAWSTPTEPALSARPALSSSAGTSPLRTTSRTSTSEA